MMATDYLQNDLSNQAAKQEARRLISSIAMTVTLISFTMLFATLFMGFIVFRFTAKVWPPMGMSELPVFAPALSTALVVFSSLFYHLFQRSFFSGNKNVGWFYACYAFGWSFLGAQLYLWHSLKLYGIYAHMGILASVIYGFTWIHAAHMVCAVLLLSWLLYVLKRETKQDKENLIINTGKFWHFLTVIWLIMYAVLFVA